ncbi:MAG: hypothetical protein AAF602_24540 [Myxococcota bacterium]
MAERIETITEDFHSIRGSFRVAGLLDIRTQASLVRLADGRFVMLDAYRLQGELEREVLRLTDDGRALAAIVNLHPFHTVHVRAVHERFPEAKLYGTARHHSKYPELPWEPEKTEDPALHALFSADLEFSVPDGVDLVTSNDNVHFGSVLAYHPASGTVHVDDTLSFAEMPSVVQWIGIADVFAFHPTLSAALRPEPGAAAAFRTWAQDLATRWSRATTVCTAHVSIWRGEPGAFQSRVLKALDGVASTLDAHARKHG